MTQSTAWTIKHQLGQVMLERDARGLLAGRIELDDAYLGGERSGGKRGHGSPGKTPFLAVVETTPQGKPVRIMLRRVTGFCSRAVEGFAKRSLDPACELVSDGLGRFAAVTKAGCQHRVIRTGSGARAVRTPLGYRSERRRRGVINGLPAASGRRELSWRGCSDPA